MQFGHVRKTSLIESESKRQCLWLISCSISSPARCFSVVEKCMLSDANQDTAVYACTSAMGTSNLARIRSKTMYWNRVEDCNLELVFYRWFPLCLNNNQRVFSSSVDTQYAVKVNRRQLIDFNLLCFLYGARHGLSASFAVSEPKESQSRSLQYEQSHLSLAGRASICSSKAVLCYLLRCVHVCFFALIGSSAFSEDRMQDVDRAGRVRLIVSSLTTSPLYRKATS